MRELDLLLAAADRGDTVQIVTVIDAPPEDKAAVGQVLLLFADGRTEGVIVAQDFTGRAVASLRYGEWPGACTRVFEGYRLFWDALGHDRFRAVILGGGHISQPLSEVLLILGYEVTVVDDRPDFANKARFPGSQVVCGGFGEYLATLRADGQTAVVIVTRGHQHDLECLRHVIGQPAGYVGMIGSRRKIVAVFDLLAGEGVGPELIGRVRAPVGLDIGAQGPGEIALSIAAEIVAAFRGGTALPLSRKEAGHG